MTRKSNSGLSLAEEIPAAFRPAQIEFVPVPQHLARCLQSIWCSDRPEHLATNERCYPDGGVSLFLTFSKAGCAASIVFSTLAVPFEALPGDTIISVRFHPGAFRECFGIQAEALPRNTLASLTALLPGIRLPEDELCRAGSYERINILLHWLTTRLHLNERTGEDRERLISALSAPLQFNDDAARQLGVSSRTLQRMCKRVLGLSPKELIQFSRIYTARQQLIYSPDSLADIALASGYFDQAHFTNHFHQFVGETPAAYRNRKLSRFSNNLI